ncbi:dihydroorotase [Acinetobacter bohemicus]|uniref:Dihydroorotase n=1 Tax=Acinetobacter lwoffii TaxID=28090 RepID=A0A9D2ZZK2_ACILW|nr:MULTISPECIES: dihydroorotase [Acinetobacter]MDM1782726.1 aspartate carbamoyltransferase [Acinetobacter indicus]HJF27977.1 dihydroorotase [Acinetobacter lwoffii]MCO8042074.1 dihydroorotase [Acinetobacter sp. S4400-12]MCU7224168.1 dihydroorotase [Acinetobacter bohemicus]QKQ70241.1 aspartate carbamoyltransferase [Acinetobacter sp. 10FS3-1]
MTIVKIENVRVLDPIQNTDTVETVYLQNGKRIAASENVSETLNGQGKWLMPTMVDLCARLREPGQQQHGTLKSEGKAARANGILHVFTPPDSKPIVQDNGALIHGLVEKAMLDGGIYLQVIGAQTQGLQGNQPANMAGLKKGGCTAVSNANAAFANDDVVLRTLEYAAGLDLTVVFYAEEPQIAKDGCVHEGFIASRQGLPMIPVLAETVAIAKYLLMIEATKVHAHFGLLSCGASVELIRAAKEKGLPVTCDVAMHQLHLTDQLIDGFNSIAHVRPPLRSEQDKELLRQGVKSGVIDAICTHHEPLSSSAKMAPFAETQPGFTAFDTYIPFGIQLVNEGLFTPLEWVEKVTIAPAKVAHMLERWKKEAGWVLVDPEHEWTLSKDTIVSQGKNTPLIQQQVKGKVVQSFIAV